MKLVDGSEEERRAYLKRKSALKRRYGVTPEQYAKMFELQGGTCAICRRPPRRRRLSVDHDHTTKRVRGLLCFTCNKYKVAKNDVDSAWAVFEYLERDFDGRWLF